MPTTSLLSLKVLALGNSRSNEMPERLQALIQHSCGPNTDTPCVLSYYVFIYSTLLHSTLPLVLVYTFCVVS